MKFLHGLHRIITLSVADGAVVVLLFALAVREKMIRFNIVFEWVIPMFHTEQNYLDVVIQEYIFKLVLSCVVITYDLSHRTMFESFPL